MAETPRAGASPDSDGRNPLSPARPWPARADASLASWSGRTRSLVAIDLGSSPMRWPEPAERSWRCASSFSCVSPMSSGMPAASRRQARATRASYVPRPLRVDATPSPEGGTFVPASRTPLSPAGQPGRTGEATGRIGVAGSALAQLGERDVPPLEPPSQFPRPGKTVNLLNFHEVLIDLQGVPPRVGFVAGLDRGSWLLGT